MIDFGNVSAFAEGSGLMRDGYPFGQPLKVLCKRGFSGHTLRAPRSEDELHNFEGTSLAPYKPGLGPRQLEWEATYPHENQVAYFVDYAVSG